MRRIRNDIILIVSILAVLTLIAFLIIINMDKGVKAVIYLGEEVIKEVYLDEDQEFIVQGKISEMTITVKDGCIRVSESGCSNQICVNDGYKHNESEIITCLPNEVYIKIVGGEWNESIIKKMDYDFDADSNGHCS